jgi:surface protein
MYRIKAEDKDHLRILIRDAIKKDGTCCDLNHIDVSQITNMSGLFEHSPFNGDISMWDVSNVTNMAFMFYASEFKSDISQWNISKVTTMRGMFIHYSVKHRLLRR